MTTCAFCGGTDFTTPRPPFRHAVVVGTERGEMHPDCEDQATKDGWFRKNYGLKNERARVSSSARPFRGSGKGA